MESAAKTLKLSSLSAQTQAEKLKILPKDVKITPSSQPRQQFAETEHCNDARELTQKSLSQVAFQERLVRAPRFEPGSSAWQADVLDQTRLRPLRTEEFSTTQELKSIPEPVDARIANTLITMQNNGNALNTVTEIRYRLRQLAKHSNLLDPEDAKHYISMAKCVKTRQPVTNETKNRYAYAYDNFCKSNGIPWEKPYYRVEEKAPMIPTKENVSARALIISNSGKRYATIFTMLAEIGTAPHELENVTKNEIDLEQGIINIRGVKGPRIRQLQTKEANPRNAQALSNKIHPEEPIPISKRNVKYMARHTPKNREKTMQART